MEQIQHNLREAFKSDLQKTYGIFHMFSETHQNASKAFLSHFRHFYFFPLWPTPHQTDLKFF